MGLKFLGGIDSNQPGAVELPFGVHFGVLGPFGGLWTAPKPNSGHLGQILTCLTMFNWHLLPIRYWGNLMPSKGTCQKRFSGFCPLRGYPPPTPLTENQWEKKKVFFLNGIGGYPPPPLNGKSQKKILKKWVKKG